MISQLDQLKDMTTIVADSGDIALIEKYLPVDATTNPTLILQAAKNQRYRHLIELAILYAKEKCEDPNKMLTLALEKVFVNFGMQILKIIPGRVSIEVDARCSFDEEKSYKKAKRIIALFEEMQIPRSRILIKLAATWEGIAAAKRLEKENIHCNLTLLFSLTQAISCAEAYVTLISPFVGRVLDWHKKNYPHKNYEGADDPGVSLVRQVYYYFKKFKYPTQIMGASFRNTSEILHLSGCDLLTISPTLLEKLHENTALVERNLTIEKARSLNIEKIPIDKASFHEKLRSNPMAYEKLHEGIKRFSEDIEKLEQLIETQLSVSV